MRHKLFISMAALTIGTAVVSCGQNEEPASKQSGSTAPEIQQTPSKQAEQPREEKRAEAEKQAQAEKQAEAEKKAEASQQEERPQQPQGPTGTESQAHNAKNNKSSRGTSLDKTSRRPPPHLLAH